MIARLPNFSWEKVIGHNEVQRQHGKQKPQYPFGFAIKGRNGHESQGKYEKSEWEDVAEVNQYAEQIENRYFFQSHILFVFYEIAQCEEIEWHRKGEIVESHVQ